MPPRPSTGARALVTGDEINGALSQFGRASSFTILAARERADHYVQALKRHGIEAEMKVPQHALIAGLARIPRQQALG